MSADFIGTSSHLLFRFNASLRGKCKRGTSVFSSLYSRVVFLPDIPAEMWLARGFSSVHSKQPRTTDLLSVCVCVCPQAAERLRALSEDHYKIRVTGQQV